MATIPRCLCVILTLWMVSSRPSASILPEVSTFGAWWGTPESKKIAKKADDFRRTGDIKTAEFYYRRGYHDAVQRRDERAMVGYLNGIAACELAQLHYRATFETLLEAKVHAKSIDDRSSLGAIAVNLSSLYFQVWDFESSLKEAEEARATVGNRKHPYYFPALLLQLARLHEIMQRNGTQDGAAASLYRQSIQAAKAAGDPSTEALGLDFLGEYLLHEARKDGGHLDEAERAIAEGMRLREKFSPKDLGFSRGWMGALKLAQGDFTAAARETDLALEAPAHISEYLLKHQRGEIRMAMGEQAEALSDFRESVDLASRWRLDVLPASSSLTAANEELERRVFCSFIEAAARQSLQTGNRRWAEESFGAVELNRAASLRESLALSDAWHRKLPPEYWEILGKVRRIDSAGLGRGPGKEESRRLRLGLAEMEAKAGLGFPAKNNEIFRDQSSLIHFQQGLGSSEVLLSFHLGDRESYLWAVTRKTLQLQRIAAAGVIRTQVLELEDAVRAGRPEAVELGERLYKELFSQLKQEAAEKSSWLLSLEGTLFEVPFAALVTERKGGKVSYLVSKHSVQTIPGALLLSRGPEVGTGGFLGVGDAIYNAADPRWGGHSQKSIGFLDLFRALHTAAANTVQFGRLVGSAEELNRSAASWDGKPAVLLEGARARRDIFLKQLEKGPAVVHLATHVVASGTRAFIAFGLGPKGESELLTTTDVASLRVPGAIVAMTGCSTGSGEARDGVGLLGLTRAWQMAGASAVVATSWPVRDSTGDVFASFYRHLRSVPAAEALRLSQMEMLQSGTWRAAPSYWAPYQIAGGAR